MSFWGPAIGATIGLLGGMYQQNKAEDSARDASEKNAQLQREFAKNGIRWRVEDAKAAGIHPLYALGAQPTVASPSYVGAGSDPNLFRDFGQDVSRAISAVRTGPEREMAALQLQSARADLDGKIIDNQIRASQLRKISQVGPALPGSENFAVTGDIGSQNVEVIPARRDASQTGRPAQRAGWIPDIAYARTDTGLVPVIPPQLSESLESSLPSSLMWTFRNNIVPNIDALTPQIFGKSDKTSRMAPPKSMLPPGATRWQWSLYKQEWQPTSKPTLSERFGNWFKSKFRR